MLGAAATTYPMRAPARTTWTGGRFDPIYFWASAYGRRPRCPYGGAWPYCREPAGGGAIIPRVKGLGIVAPDRMPGAFAPSFSPMQAAVGTGPRRPPPPPLRTFRGLGALDPAIKNTVLLGIAGGVLFGFGLGYFVYGR